MVVRGEQRTVAQRRNAFGATVFYLKPLQNMDLRGAPRPSRNNSLEERYCAWVRNGLPCACGFCTLGR